MNRLSDGWIMYTVTATQIMFQKVLKRPKRFMKVLAIKHAQIIQLSLNWQRQKFDGQTFFIGF